MSSEGRVPVCKLHYNKVKDRVFVSSLSPLYITPRATLGPVGGTFGQNPGIFEAADDMQHPLLTPILTGEQPSALVLRINQVCSNLAVEGE